MIKVRKYEPFCLSIPKMGYFILYRHERGLIGDIIKKRQLQAGFSEEDASYTHVEVSGGGQHSIFVGLPKSRPVDIRKKHKGEYARIVTYVGYMDYECRIGYHKRYKVAYWSATMNNIGYDVLGVASFMCNIIKQDKKKYFCSENALEALQNEYPDALGGMKPSECMPAHFTDKKNFFTIWEGVIR